MLELDEYGQLLVTNLFADDTSTVSPSNINHDILGVTLTRNSSPQYDPLRSRSVSPAFRTQNDMQTVTGSEGEAQPRLTPPLNLHGSSSEMAGEDGNTGSATKIPRSSDTIIHPVGPNDSYAGVALRYGVSIAVLRRANQLWPSDPIHLRTELLIPRGDARRARHKPTHGPRTDASVRSAAEPPPDMSLDLVTSSLVAARDMFLSVLPARISLDSLSSRASMSEDHELDDLEAGRRRKMLFAMEPPFAQDGHELDMLAVPRAQRRLPDVAVSCSPERHVDASHVSGARDLRSRSISSSHTVSLQRLPRRQPFAVLPVRTSQLEPEPVMELPVRRSRRG
ncbi:hypothetical protein JVT61DRAFT_3276 [Boletus reticuloceps]|uniref:LysM domain-containing protein n=1 Tax=Boletus reticuloceps TaxID=495285 RepID=A0A8I2YPF2_9AGAM|nr:hypothetical protein JVT61DRAFT_3276 [Boletus reticuloceps]